MTRPLKVLQPNVQIKPRDEYRAIAQINGSHPFRHQVPESIVEYPVQELPSGKVTYFNFRLAKEMGLISKSHPHKVTKGLESTLLKTFCLRIINEYDQEHGTKPLGPVKPHTYMATRYLQLQHKSKRGKTSGDGRSIWNGVFRNSNGRVWDISSRGTGVTKLSPGAVEAGKHLATGTTDFGYGCGLAEIDELVSSTIMSEILHADGFRTERMLCIIDLGKGLGIGVRAAENLLRPAHLFLHLKQGNHKPLTKAFKYLVNRQIQNGHWPANCGRPKNFLKTVTREFAEFAVLLDFHHVFAWMDWDGDNLLAHAGIIDYGSIRQFGLRHDQYRYDDIDRFSTNLTEQRVKARQTVQAFAQMANFIETGVKKPLSKFKHASCLRDFDKTFEDVALREFLKFWGDVQNLSTRGRRVSARAFKDVLHIEKFHSSYPLQKLPDGVHRPALYNRRKLLSTWAKSRLENFILSPEALHKMSLATSVRRKDRKFTLAKKRSFTQVIKSLDALWAHLKTEGHDGKHLLQHLINRCERPMATGNGVEEMVDVILSKKRTPEECQALMDGIVRYFTSHQSQKKFGPEGHLSGTLLQDLQESLLIAQEREEDI